VATVTGYTAAKMDQIADETVIGGSIVGDNLILETRGGPTIDAGDVRGPVGPQASTMTVVANQAALPTYTAGTGHDNDVGFTDDTNEFWIWSDSGLSWTKIASTIPAVIGDPVLLTYTGTKETGDALFGHVTPGVNAGLKVTSAGGIILTSLTDIRLYTPAGLLMTALAAGGVNFASKIGLDDNIWLSRSVNTLRLMDPTLSTYKSLQAQNLTAEGTALIKGAAQFLSSGAFSGVLSAPSGSVSGQWTAGTLQVVGTATANVLQANSYGTIPSLYTSWIYGSLGADLPVINMLKGGPSGSPNGNDYWSTYTALRIKATASDATALMAFHIPSRGWAAMWGMTDVGTDPAFHALNLANTGYVRISAAGFDPISTAAGKKDIEELPKESLLTKLGKVSGKKYKRTTTDPSTPAEVGVIAEDLEAAGLNDIVVGEGMSKGYSLTGLVTYLLDAVNLLSAEVADLKAQLAEA
jgi:hypothetical protein